jgi:luciferase family oxidoreductase group 1
MGLLDFVPLLEDADPAEAIRQSVRLAQLTEDWGYERYWITEHHDMERLASANPELLLAHIGLQTRRIRLGTGALLLPYYNPMKVAETFQLLETLHPGRIDLGIGRAPGGSAHASMALSGGTFLELVRRLPEQLDELVRFLTNQYRIDDQPVYARPIPLKPPQLWLLGTNRKSAQYAAERGAGFVFGQFMSDEDGRTILDSYRREFRPSPFGSEPQSIVAVGTVCAETDEEAAAIAAAVRRRAFGDMGAGSGASESAAAARKLMAGSPGTSAERLLELQRYYEADELLLVTMTETYEQRLASFRLLAEALSG